MSGDFASWKFKSEAECVQHLAQSLDGWDMRPHVQQQTRVLIEGTRAYKGRGQFQELVDGFSLSTQEGLALMALAEALLRIPDAATLDALLKDKLSDADFEQLFGQATNWLGKLSGFGLKVTQGLMGGMTGRMGMPVIRKAAIQGVRLLGDSFVMGQTIEDALNAANSGPRGYAYSFDMLGEGARNDADAQTNYAAYVDALSTLGRSVGGARADVLHRHGISVKLSAIHPRYEAGQSARAVAELSERLGELCRLAAGANLNLTVDAEEVDRLSLSLMVIDGALKNSQLKGWDGFGLAVQAYQKMAFPLLQELVQWSYNQGRRLNIRLVKGAYWDTEIKRAQVAGLADYPLFTRKEHTDLSYLACAKLLLDNREHVVPLFGTHNASTASSILDLAGDNRSGFGFQRLYGMGEGLHAQLLSMDVPCSIYAPVGAHDLLLAYLVRRLLENGANSSFVNKIADLSVPAEQLIENPLSYYQNQSHGEPHPRIIKPEALFEPERKNSRGYDLGERATLKTFERTTHTPLPPMVAESLIDGKPRRGTFAQEHVSPQDTGRQLGEVWWADAPIIDDAFTSVQAGFAGWHNTDVHTRAQIIERYADLLEAHTPELINLCTAEAGKTILDGVAEVREAVDFCRYYAARARTMFGAPILLPGPTGEQNSLIYEGRGVFVCISPWNFPLAIFTGQIVAALLCGNTVVAKPAEQTPMVALRAVELMIEAGLPANAIALVLGDGRVGEMIVNMRGVSGVAFTGSNAAAKAIQKTLADKPGPIVPLVAETGGLNAMIVDSSALPEQVCDDVIQSAFGSAGQRCSALRLLCVQEDVADKICTMISGAMHELVVGDPADAASDLGPLIDAQARANVGRHKTHLRGARILAETPMEASLETKGHFVAPMMAEIASLDAIKREVFGPVLHVYRYNSQDLDDMVAQLNAKGFGLTFGVHSRIFAQQRHLANTMRVGNVYINRSMIGAVVGVQPFGGMGLSGTGPKAGGPNYLPAFATEKVISVDTTASGGNTTLLTLGYE